MASMDGYRALREAAGLIDRSGRTRLRLTGADRRAYLQGLLTNDIVGLAPGTGCYAAYLTAQGRMIADMRVFEMGEALLIDLDGESGPSVRDKFSLFIFSEDVQIEDITSSTGEIGVYGPRAPEMLASAVGGDPARFESMPLFANVAVDLPGGSAVLLRSDDAGVMGFDLIVPLNVKDELIKVLRAAGAVDSAPDAFDACRIEAGRPLFHVDMDADTIPLEAGIEDRAISLTKGCYVGQEIIIRVLHRGKGRVARRLVGLSFDPSAPVPARGQTILAAEKEAGRITSAVLSPTLGRPIALGYVHRDFVEPGTVVHAAGIPASVTALPFVPAAAST